MNEVPPVRQPAADLRTSKGVKSALAQLVRTAANVEVTVEDILRELCLAAARAVRADGAGVMIAVGDDPRFIHAHPRQVVALERLQMRQKHSPGRDSLRQRQAVVVDDLTVCNQWPELVNGSSRMGLRSVLAMPLLAPDGSWGVLHLYRSAAQSWTAHDLAVVRWFADVAGSYIALAAERDRARIARRGFEHPWFEHRAPHDEAGLPNLGLVLNRVEHAVRTATAQRRVVAVLMVTIEGFKAINDTLGDAAGDAVLAEVGRRIGLALGTNDTLARLAREQFVVICEDLTGSPTQIHQQLRALGRRIQLHLRRPPRAREVEVVVSVSIGVATATYPRSAPDLIHAADRAVRRATQPGTIAFAAPHLAYRWRTGRTGGGRPSKARQRARARVEAVAEQCQPLPAADGVALGPPLHAP